MATPDRQPLPAGAWVQVYRIALTPDQRAPNLPPDTATLPYETWVKGFLVEPACVGEQATVRTMAGRLLAGRLLGVDQGYCHSFGKPIPELLRIGPSLREMLEGEP
jgi:hypothetical protein